MDICYGVILNGIRALGVAPLAGEDRTGKLTVRTYDAEALGAALRITERADDSLKCRVLQVRVTNQTDGTLRVSKADSGIMATSVWGLLKYFSSNWGREFDPLSIRVTETQSIQVLSGRSAKGYAPWVALKCEEGYFSMAVAWSGNWKAAAERIDGRIYATMGIFEGDFYTDLAPGEHFDGAEVYLAYDPDDEEMTSIRLRRFFMENFAILSPWTKASLPAVYNTWWCYEDRFLSEDMCLRNAKLANEAGIDQFMLDAGWFGETEGNISWFGKRGDWDVINTRDFPGGMERLGAAISAEGIRFGIWCEIEAVGEYAALNASRPDLIATRNGQSLHYICMGNPEARRWAMGVIAKLVETYNAKWVKLDFNYDPEMGCNAPGHGHGEGDGLYAHYMGYYRFLTELRERFPELHIENCCSGGLRQDLGMIAHTHCTFLSDPDYMDHHFQVFWGVATYVHPALCYHFAQSQCLGDINDIMNPISEDMEPKEFDYYMRAALLSMAGFSFRFEDWPRWCLDRLKGHIAFYKEYSRKYVLEGDMVRLTGQAIRDGGGDRWQAYQYHAADDSSVILAFRLPGASVRRALKLRLMDPEARYAVRFEDSGHAFEASGHALMTEGLLLGDMDEKTSEIIRVRRI